MPMESSDLHQFAVLWTLTGSDAYGEPTITGSGTYTELPVRWEHKVRDVLRPDGTPQQVDAAVVVNQEVSIGSLIWEGAANDLPSPISGITDVYQVVATERIPDVKNRATRRRLFVIKFRDGLPS